MRCRRLVPPLAGLALLAALAAPAGAQEVTVKPQGPPAGEVADLLRPPGSDPYAPAVDWSRVPPWRQASFFDVRAQGTFFLFVVDCSGSMGDDDRLLRAKAELRRAVSRLQFPQRYMIIFYNDRPLPMPGGVPVSARPEARRRTSGWLGLVEAEGETDPRGAMRMALALRPNAVFLLSDGEYPEGSAEAIAEANARLKARVPIHCIDLSGGAAGDDLKRIAEESGGQYASRP
jgi:hypothetical protein